MRVCNSLLALLLSISTTAKAQQQLLSTSQSISILCFGDSLTAGYVNLKGQPKYWHPYAISLQRTLSQAYPEANITISNQGLGGDRVLSPPGSFLPRINEIYGSGEKYDYAIVLGGTNDLNNGEQSDEIFDALKVVWNVAFEHGSEVLALSVPESSNKVEVTPVRNILNAHILAYSQSGFYTWDLATAVPYFDMPAQEKKQFWSDGTHFTSAGYDRIGEMIGRRIMELIGDNQEGETGDPLQVRSTTEEAASTPTPLSTESVLSATTTQSTQTIQSIESSTSIEPTPSTQSPQSMQDTFSTTTTHSTMTARPEESFLSTESAQVTQSSSPTQKGLASAMRRSSTSILIMEFSFIVYFSRLASF